MASMMSAGKPPRVKLPAPKSSVIGESSLGKLDPFAEGASAILFKGKIDEKKARQSNPKAMAKYQAKMEFDKANRNQKESAKSKNDAQTGMVVAVKLARSREGQIHEDVEAEMKLLHCLVRDWPKSNSKTNQGASQNDEDIGEEEEYDFGDAIEMKRRELIRGGAENVIQMIGAGLFHDLRRFIVFEYCNSTLEELLDIAEKPTPKAKGSWMSFGTNNRPQIDMARALKIGFELSLAVSYLHNEALPNHVVLHRDIKPSNIGLTATGSVRLLDLGLARAIPKVDMAQFKAMNDTSNPTARQQRGVSLPIPVLEKEVADAKKRQRLLPPYEMTGYTGSLRYMAPEVAVNQPYDESVDVYSMSLVLWEIASLERPYKGYNKAKFFDRVVRHKERPVLDDPEWPMEFKQLLSDGWNHNASKRPCSASVSEDLFEMTVQQRYRNSVDEAEQFEIPALYTTYSGAGGLVRRLSEMTTGSRRGSEFVDGEK
jgi:serine/threonine protein kinase